MFADSDLVIGNGSDNDVYIVTTGANGNIEFMSSQSILVNALPATIRAAPTLLYAS